MELKRETAGINANGLKLIAIAAMTVDHLAWILLPLELPGTEALVGLHAKRYGRPL